MSRTRFNTPLPLVRETHMLGPHTRERVGGVMDCPAVAASGLTFVGLSHARSGFRFATQGWRYSQVLVCHGGWGQVQLGEQWVRCQPGMAYLTPAGIPHAYRCPPRVNWRICWVTYDPLLCALPLDHAHEPSLIQVNPLPLKWAVQGLCTELLTSREPALLQSWTEMVRLLIQRMMLGGKRPDRLWSLWHAVDADPARPWSLEDLAYKAHLSPEHLRRLCHQECGRSPMLQVTHLRMRKAAELLRSTDMKIEEIAANLGYADRFGFSQAFKRTFAQAPAQYRQQAR